MVVRLGKDKKPDMQFDCNGENANESLNLHNNYGNDLKPPGKTRKDGKPDMRCTANKKWAAKHNITVPNSRPQKKKDGQPKMRHTLNKKGIAEREVDKNVAANKEPLEPVMNADVENVKFGLVNSRSLLNKLEKLDDEIAKSKLDIIAVTETHFKDDSHLEKARPKGFKGVHEPRRDGRRGGGVAIFYRDDIKLTRHSLVKNKSFEYIDVSLDIGSGKKIRLLNIYRPGKYGSSKVVFLEEFKTLLRESMEGKEKLLITGDFNLHVENPDNNDQKFQKLIESNSLIQHIKKATHQDGGILDLIITRASDSLVENVQVDEEFFSDHKFIKCTLLVEKEEIFEREE
jgi:exonuclease III